ncbi:MAG TPA: hypothetical protein VFW14_02255 [Gaiellales bacterium]|jgi:hypothetical protein|nr:hypothetical protein [Gaiellales bacterium]
MFPPPGGSDEENDMGTNIRTRFTGRHGDGSASSPLNDRDVESALGRLAAYDDDRPQDRRRPPSSTPALRGRAGLWKR